MARLSRKKSKSRRPGKPRKSKKTKRKKSSKKSVSVSVSSSKSCVVEMKNKELTALCMKCYRMNGEKRCVMKIEGRKCKKTKNNRNMILGMCVKCGGKMARLL